MRVPPRPEAVAEPEEVDFIDGAQHLGDRALDDLVLQRRHAERSLPAIGFGDVDAPHRLRPVAPGVDARAEVLEVALQVLLVHRHRHPVDSRTCLPLLAPERSFERRDVDMMQQGGEPGLDGRAGRRVHPREVGRQGDPALCPDPVPPRAGFLPGWPLPSARLVSFDGVISTMNQSDSRPQLGWRLRQCLAALPRRRPIRRTRSGLSCSDECFPCVIRPSTPAERRHLA